MQYTEKDLPVSIRESEFVVLSDGTQLRYEESGGARDVFVNDDWCACATLFPGSEHCIECQSGSIRLVAEDVGLRVEKMQ